jgi:hypothetical protein
MGGRDPPLIGLVAVEEEGRPKGLLALLFGLGLKDIGGGEVVIREGEAKALLPIIEGEGAAMLLARGGAVLKEGVVGDDVVCCCCC